MTNLECALIGYVMNTRSQYANFRLGLAYDELGHTSSAASFYLRTAEYGSDKLLMYEALLRLGLCFYHQGSRMFTVTGVFLRAVSLFPERPEAYYLMARSYEKNKAWQESYTWSVVGEKLPCMDCEPLKTDVEYPGRYGFTFQKAVAAWWIGLHDESMHLFRKLLFENNMSKKFKRSVENNIERLDTRTSKPIYYHKDDHHRLRYKFPGSLSIKRNYSQCFQDMFVLSLSGKKDKYLEIGSADPLYGSNTKLLEEKGWSGISIDKDPSYKDEFNKLRVNKMIVADALTLNWYEVLGDEDVFGYLQIDCDPPGVSLAVLKSLPLDSYRFGIITFEHDNYYSPHTGIKEEAMMYLQTYGYRRIVNNVAPNDYDAFEDWYVHPELVDMDIALKFEDVTSKPIRGDRVLLYLDK